MISKRFFSDMRRRRKHFRGMGSGVVLIDSVSRALSIGEIKIQKVLEQQPEKNNTLVFGGILLAMSSIGLLIFVLSDKVFHLS